jgi:hypothetical protein
MPALLTDDILRELERRWADLGTSMSERMGPGLSDGENDRIAAPLGFRVPEEARMVFRWHDGSGLKPFVLGRTLVSLEGYFWTTLDFRAFAEALRPERLHFLDEKPYVALDCGGAFDGSVPAWHYDEGPDAPTRPVFDSIGDMFLFWIGLIDSGSMRWDDPLWSTREPLSDGDRQKLRGVSTP